MKVPVKIRDHMHALCRSVKEAESHMISIEDWLRSKGIDPEDLRDGSGRGLDELEYGLDVTEELCQRLELEKDKA